MHQRTRMITLFDLNGTLLNDMPIWYGAISKVFEICRIKPVSIAEYFLELEQNHGNFWPIYYSRGVCLEKEEMNNIYQAEYASHLDEIELSPGAADALQTLADLQIPTGIITMQIPSLFEPLLKRLDLRRFFGERIFTDISDKKQAIQYLAGQASVPIQNCLYVGDAPSDVHHAKKAGATAVAYLNGYIPKNLVMAAEPHYAISHFQELTTLVKELLGGNK